MKTWSNWPTSAVVLCFAAAMVRCGSDGGAGGTAAEDASEGDWDDGAADSGVPTVTGSGGAAPSLPPEEENESSFRVPVATDHYVWTANPLSGMVALIDARDRSVRTVPAGFGPTYLAAVPTPEGSDESRAIVINVLSQDAHLLVARADGEIDSYRINGIHPGANSWAISPGGRWAIAWTNVAEVTDPDPIEGFQDISVVDLDAVGEDTVEATRLNVAFRPTRLFISDDETRAFAVTEPGITVIDLGGSSPRVVEDLPVGGESIDDPAARDVNVTPDGRFAVVRREGSSDVHILSLDTDAEPVTVTLVGPVTDLDLSGDGSTAVAVVRSQSSAVVVGTGGSTGASGAAGAPAAGGAGQMAGAAGAIGVSGSAGALGSGGVVAAGGSAAQGGEAGTPDAGGGAGIAPTGGEGGAAPGGAAGMPVAAGAPGLAGAAGSSAGGPAQAGAAGSSAGSPGLAGAAGWPGGSAGLAGAAGWPGGAFGTAGAAGWLSTAGAAGSAGSAGAAGAPDVGIGGQVSTGGSTGAGGLASGGDTGVGGASSGGSGVGGGTGGLLTGGSGGLLGSGGAVVGLGGFVGTGGGSGGAPTITYDWGPSYVYILNISETFADPAAFDPGDCVALDEQTVGSPRDCVALDEEIVGSVSLSELGTQALLFTTADAPPQRPQANQHLTVLDLSGEVVPRTEHLRAAVHAVFVSPDDGHAIALLTPGPDSTMAGAFSVVPVSEPLPPRIQGTTAPPVGVALAASPANMGLVTVSDPVREIYETYLVQLPGLQVDAFELARRPLATGIVPSVAAGYVAQEHPDGRITFITFDSDNHPIDYTLTGFELGATTGR